MPAQASATFLERLFTRHRVHGRIPARQGKLNTRWTERVAPKSGASRARVSKIRPADRKFCASCAHSPSPPSLMQNLTDLVFMHTRDTGYSAGISSSVAGPTIKRDANYPNAPPPPAFGSSRFGIRPRIHGPRILRNRASKTLLYYAPKRASYAHANLSS